MTQKGRTTAQVQLVQSIKHPRFINENLGDELVVFDRNTNKAHLLDARSAAVFRACGDGAALSELESLMGEGSAEKRAALARIAVLELERVGLVVTSGRDEGRVSRRSLLKTIGTAAALPLIISIVAPSPAAALTAGSVPLGGTCETPTDCNCPGCKCEPTGGGGPASLKCCAAGLLGIGTSCNSTPECCDDLTCFMSGPTTMQCCLTADTSMCSPTP